MSILNSVDSTLKIVTPTAIDTVKSLFGFNAKIYEPVTRNSIYMDHSEDITYGKAREITALITGVPMKKFSSVSVLDSLFNDGRELKLVDYEEYAELSLIEIPIGEKVWRLKIRQTTGLYVAEDTPIYYEHLLSPYAGGGMDVY